MCACLHEYFTNFTFYDFSAILVTTEEKSALCKTTIISSAVGKQHMKSLFYDARLTYWNQMLKAQSDRHLYTIGSGNKNEIDFLFHGKGKSSYFTRHCSFEKLLINKLY